MGIVSSVLVLDSHTQADGSKWAKEIHTDNTGVSQHVIYRLPAGQGQTEAQATMNARVPSLNTQLAEVEADKIINGA